MKEANQARNSNSTDRIIIASEEDSDQLELYCLSMLQSTEK